MSNTSTHATPSHRTSYLWLICLVAAMGGLLFGYDWVVIGGAKPFYEPFFAITADTPLRRGWAMSSALVGCMVGAIAGIWADRYGRKPLLAISAVLFTASAIGTALAWDFTSFNVFRIVGGVGIGIAASLSPLYIAEVSPPAVRGRFVSVNQLTIVLGILGAQVINLWIARGAPDAAAIPDSWYGQWGWRWMFGAETVPAAAFLVLILFIPESPRWLIGNGQIERGRDILTRIAGRAHADREVADILGTLDHAKIEFRALLEPRVMKLLAFGLFLTVFQQWCGINVIFSYAQEVFASAGYTSVNAMMVNIVITGVVLVVFTVVAMLTVDRLGRRPLMLLGSGGLALIYGVLGLGYFTGTTGTVMVVLVVSAIACYAMTLAPVVWVVVSEIFPNRVRGAAVAIAVFALWVGNAALAFTFPILHDGLTLQFDGGPWRWNGLGPHGTFWLYGAICLLGFVVIFRRLPETKGKSLEAVEHELIDR